MEKANGSFDSPPKAMNSANGFASGMNGHASSTSWNRPIPKKRAGFFSWILSLVTRLVAWYSIWTILFRCPATLDQCTETSPKICHTYFQVKQAVSPHLEPYYDAYAAPYIDLARPYYDTVDQKVLTPTWAYATKYGGPRIQQAQAFSREQWEKSIQPELYKYQELAKAKYDQVLAPHVDQATSVVAPYYDIARTNALQTYHELILPSYVVAQPYMQQGYTTASKFTTETAVPSVVWAWNKTYVFLDGTVWPQLVYVYSENVEPQIRKISQRLGRHNASNTQKPAETVASTAAKAASTVTKPTSLVSTASATPASSSAETSSSESSSSDAAPPSSSEAAPATSDDAPASTESVESSGTPPESLDQVGDKIKEEEVAAPDVVPGESEVRRNARITVAQDLKDWQEKYAQAADEGAAEIDDRIDEISKRMINRQVKTMGKSLISQLNDSVAAETKTLKADIQSIVGEVKKGSETEEAALEKVAAAVRRAGLEIKDKSQDVRLWSENYEKELQATVVKAAENHFKILEGIRDLALQKIGMKWAWMDGVTYKDWAKYHQLKGRFDEWEADLKNLITSHPGLQEAEDQGRAIESDAMAIAQAAVKELTTLKQVGGWKITAQDDSDNFDAESMQLAAEEVLKAAAAEAETPPPEPEPEVDTEVDDAGVAGTIPSDEDPTPAPEDVSATVAPGQDAEDAHDTPDLVSSVILKTTQVFLDNVTEATKPAEPVESVEHQEIEETDETGSVDEADETEAIFAEELEPVDPTASVKPAFLGAAAQSVPSRQPILDVDNDSGDTFEAVGSIISAMQSDVPATIASAASSAYSAAISGASERYSQALSLVSVQVSGTPKPAHEELLASVTSAYGNAVAAASSRLDAALSAASGGIFAATTPTSSIVPALATFADWAKIESIAEERLNEGRAWAEEQYESAKVAIGLATPTPTDIAGSASSMASAATAVAGETIEKMLHNAQHNYYAGLGLAQARYSEFIAAASSALSSVTATPTPTDLAGTVSSAASVASESAASVVSVVGENASSVAAAGYENVAESWHAVMENISAQVYGQPTPTAWYEDFYKTAGDYAASATEAVGSGTEAVTSAAGAYAAAASGEVSKQYVLVSSIVSELLVGKEPTFGESVLSRLAEAYEVASSTASSLASAAAETAASATDYVKDEL